MKICYFGIYNPDFSRNKIFQKGLRGNGVEIIDCRDDSVGLMKFVRLFVKHRKIKDDYDVLIVGYPGQLVVPLAKSISRKKVVFDSLCPLYDGEIASRQAVGLLSFKRLKVFLIDFFAYSFADLILLETTAQIEFVAKKYWVKKTKCLRVFTGVDDTEFFREGAKSPSDKFTVFFRGQFLPEAGVDTILRAAKILEKQDINFIIMGGNFLKQEITALAESLQLKNTKIIDGFLSFEQIRQLMSQAQVCLGQFGKNERLERTIPHKAFETLASGLPYITGSAGGVSELLTDGKNCLMSKLSDPADLADKIMILKNNPALAKKIADNGYNLYQQKLNPKYLAAEIIKAIE